MPLLPPGKKRVPKSLASSIVSLSDDSFYAFHFLFFSDIDYNIPPPMPEDVIARWHVDSAFCCLVHSFFCFELLVAETLLTEAVLVFFVGDLMLVS